MSSCAEVKTSHLRPDERGSVTILFGFVFVMLLACIGGGVDLGRWMHARQTTKSALDAAVLVGGRTLLVNRDQPALALLAAKNLYDENIKKRLPLQSDSVQFVLSDNNTAVTIQGTAALKTVLLNLIGINELPLIDNTGVKVPKAKISVGGAGGSNIEVALMLDVTGSMCDDGIGPCSSGNKITGMKDAAKELIDIVVSPDQSEHTSKVAIVPFSTRIRVGPDAGGGDMMMKLTNLDATWTGWFKECLVGSGGEGSETETAWVCQQYQTMQVSNWKIMPCVTDRYYNNLDVYDYTDAAPGPGKWLGAHDGSRMPVSLDSSDDAPSSQKGLTSADPAEHWNFRPDGDCADILSGNEVAPLSANKEMLKSRINSLQAYGSTAGALGTAWAWYMISPNWSGVWTGESTPAPYAQLTQMQPNGAPVLRKVAVLMSDGGYNTYRSWKGEDQQLVSNHAKQLCSAMKAQGIEIYAVAFALDTLPPAERAHAEHTLKSCGTDLDHFYTTLNVQQLQQAFRDIAMDLSSVYLAQ